MLNNNDRPKVGPESIPLKQWVKSFNAVILIYNVSDDNIVRKEVIDYGDSEQRKWLGKVTFWAWQNGMYVKTLAESDYKE